MVFRTSIMLRFLCLLAAGICCSCSSGTEDSPTKAPVAADKEPLPALEPGFVRYQLADFDMFREKPQAKTRTWTEQDGIIHCVGKPRGYLYTKQKHRNFTLRADLRYASDASPKSNTGILVYVNGPEKIWPTAVEIQGKHAELATLLGSGKPNPLPLSKVHDNEEARKQARRPFGGWNSIEVVSRDGRLSTSLNGVKICEGEPADVSEGTIAIQSEGHPYDLRNFRIHDESTP